MSAYVELYEVSKTYPTRKGKHVVVEHFNLKMTQGEFVALIGHSGCGKSTILGMIAGLNPLTAGGIIVASREVSGPGPDRAVVFQSPCLLPWLSAYQNVRLGVDTVYSAKRADQRHQITLQALDLVGLSESIRKLPRELSSGMQQRVGIARAFALQPKMLLLDEPFGMLDSLTRMELQEILLGLVEQERNTALIVTHDVDEALFLADRVVMMTSGPRAHVGRILEVPFERPRTRTQVVEHPRYYELREELISFLESQHTQGGADDAGEAA
jgi:nitrate ABC transporter ATP-binding subunit